MASVPWLQTQGLTQVGAPAYWIRGQRLWASSVICTCLPEEACLLEGRGRSAGVKPSCSYQRKQVNGAVLHG